MTTTAQEIQAFHNVLERTLQAEVYLGHKIVFGGERETTFLRRGLDRLIAEAHIATCPFAKQHKHAVGPVEQLESYDARYRQAQSKSKGIVTNNKRLVNV